MKKSGALSENCTESTYEQFNRRVQHVLSFEPGRKQDNKMISPEGPISKILWLDCATQAGEQWCSSQYCTAP